jgi:molybdopterin biosynthesis enzyme
MQIRIDPHTIERALERGANEAEIRDVLETGDPIQAKHNRLAKTKVYDYNSSRAGNHYEQKRVEVIYLIENDCYVTVTVYVFYGKWR